MNCARQISSSLWTKIQKLDFFGLSIRRNHLTIKVFLPDINPLFSPCAIFCCILSAVGKKTAVASSKVLVVEDHPALRRAISEYLTSRGFEVLECDGCHTATQALARFRPDAAVLDYSLHDGNALGLLEQIKHTDPLTSVIILTGNGTIELAVEAIKKGAENFLTKPVELSALSVLLERSLKSQAANRTQLARRVQHMKRNVDPFVGTSAAIQMLRDQAQRIVASESPVLIQGETGTGKTVLAKWIHSQGSRRDGPFVDLNCATFSRELLESELFGFEKGAFTGALNAKPGLFEVAHKGSLLLDEIGDLDPKIQPKLLKVLEEKQLRRIGDVRDRSIDARLIAATHQELLQLVDEKRFRSDLYFRVSTIPLRIPPLRERREDIPALSEFLLERSAVDIGRSGMSLSGDAIDRLSGYHWPGNIRELRNILERAVLFNEGEIVRPSNLQFEMHRSSENGLSTQMTLLQMEKTLILAVLREEQGKVPRAAERLGIPRSSLYQKIKTYGLSCTPEHHDQADTAYVRE
jgi:DNA-binding NtrC family response regulator